MTVVEAIIRMNKFGEEKKAFFFFFDFELQKPLVYALDKLPDNILFKLNNISNAKSENLNPVDLQINIKSVQKKKYFKSFEDVYFHLLRGNSYLLNLTMPSEIETKASLENIFEHSKAPYKVLIKNKLVCFSPESFVNIKNNKIYSYPMKGTIDASIPDAKKIILENKKEIYEHNTIVDLIRNDLSQIAENVRLTKFRYIEKIKTTQKTLLQVSSEIVGDLDKYYAKHIGDIIVKLLPAGSISGAPKEKTIEIIRNAEKYERAYYTGVFGLFDGENLTSAVAIRFIEKIDDKLYYKSGGGITTLSNKEDEFEELINKIYVPIA